ncbi:MULTISPECIES: hypothetical protein [Parachlamydia]|jgi:hypothetical protein|uniref:Uncharacterized protein n=2 Tax=Parachlamydia acanthamoebae TaxID=83552 RepID=F8L0W3_PARAV|nr:hypothetical protein [Parachlamydia acanthamoebae]EFB42656.1 hypothetical protein pah_c004o193 [Parachlamydia acanthamoebae str. Hall's coccus]CCB86871.1 putative uncharacterized protein [Parachlamydia acanthamoebae UV-7]
MSLNLIEGFCRLLMRFRYPVSLPEDIAQALGISFSNFLTFDQLIEQLIDPNCSPKRLKKYMPREDAEAAFESACKKDKFSQNSLFSYYFNEGWLEFILQFDSHSRLRRIYIHHNKILQEEGAEIPLKETSPL